LKLDSIVCPMTRRVITTTTTTKKNNNALTSHIIQQTNVTSQYIIETVY
jgi:hypothetical protein